MKLTRKAFAAGLISAALSTTMLVPTSLVSSAQAAGVTITGSGSTFVKNYIEACAPGFAAATGDTVIYAGGGSGKGRTDITNKTVDFGVSDTAFAAGSEPAGLVHIPLIAGPIALMYRIDGFTGNLYLKKDTVAKVFSGQIKMWNDPQILADNRQTVQTPVYKTKTVTIKGKKVKQVVKDKKGKPIVARYVTTVLNAKLPAKPIRVFYRSDSSGTSGIFTAWLNATSSIWTKASNNSFSAAFPGSLPTDGTFQSASGSDGVSNGVQQTDGGITYSEVSYATERKLGTVFLENEAGKYVAPTAAGASAFLSSFTPGARGVITPNYKNTDPSAYNLTAYAYGLAYTTSAQSKAATVKAFFNYMLTTCVNDNAERLGYAPLSGEVLVRSKVSVENIGG
jgi:phosphate transport system substrate-binding protein